MKLSSLKVVGVFMIATIAIIAGGLSIYFLIQNNKTYYIYDIRIVEPLEDTGYFVYTNKEDSEGNEPEYDLVSMQNKNVFLTNSEANKFEIGVYADTSTNTTSIDITSSNTDIATISYSKGRCFVEYHRAGQVEITAEYGGVSDSITVNVYDNVSESFLVYDEAFYGKYHTTFNNNIVTYADDIIYNYNYKSSVVKDYDKVIEEYENKLASMEEEYKVAFENIKYDPESKEYKDIIASYQSVLESYKKIIKEVNVVCNDELLRVDPASIDTTIFDFVRIDPVTRTLCVKCHSKDAEGNVIDQTKETSLVVQSFYYTDEGELKVKNNYIIEVKIVADNPEYLQILLSTTPDFEDESVYIYTKYIEVNSDKFDPTNKDLVKEVLSNQKEKNNLYAGNEKETYNAFFTDKVSKIYIRFRKVYTNGNIVYLNPLSKEKNPFVLEIFEGDLDDNGKSVYKDVSLSQYLEISANKNYYILSLTKEYFDTNTSFKVKLTLEDFPLDTKEFVFEYRELSKENITDFYTYDEETGVYTYKYWDPRTGYNNEVYDVFGNIIDFAFED